VIAMSAITTHVLDTSRGQPASGVRVALDALEGGDWRRLGAAETDADGRVRTLLPADTPLTPGVYRLTFDTAPYFEVRNLPTIYPAVVVLVRTEPGHAHYHVPLLISPFGYTTYRGS
jgi:5-hydroxyisourate hydrolase